MPQDDAGETPSAPAEYALDEIKAKAETAQQEKRLAALWSYGDEPVKGGSQLSAAIFSQEPVDTDGSGARPVRLIFRDHPEWGRSSYLVLEAGDFDQLGQLIGREALDETTRKRLLVPDNIRRWTKGTAA